MSYVYRHVKVIRVVDGDTVELEIDLGNSIRWRGNFRLFGIDTPEKKQAGYQEAIAFLSNLLAVPLTRVETHKPDKFGRWLVDIFIPTDQGGELHVNTLMIVNGYAKEYFGGKKT